MGVVRTSPGSHHKYILILTSTVGGAESTDAVAGIDSQDRRGTHVQLGAVSTSWPPSTSPLTRTARS